jgi:urease beta subunit-like protein
MPKAKKRTVKPAKKTGSSLAATIRAELAKPVIPGQILFAAGDLDALTNRHTKELTVKNSADRPIQVGSHCHFFEVNRGLVFDREQAFGFRARRNG